MTNTEVLTVEADSERGTITVQGRIFLGGVYDVDITLNKAACDDTYRVAFFTYENRAKPLYLGIVGGLGEDGKRGRISFSNGDLIDCYRPQSRVWNASIPIYAYLYQALPVDESGKSELPDYQQDGFADPIHIIAEGRFDLLWTPILGEKTLANEKVIVAAVGPQGPTGEKGDKGRDGVNGITYKPQLRRNADGDIFVDWLEKDKDGEYTVVAYEGRTNIKGDKGERGESSFEVAKNNGFLGNEQAWVYTVQNVSKNADRAKDAAEATENAQKAVAQYVDVTFPAKATEAEKTLENATKASVQAVVKKGTDAIEAVGTYASKIETALDGKLSTASTAINEAVGKAETAKGDAEKAKREAEASAKRAEVALNNGCVYEVLDVADATIGLDKTLTAYKHAPTSDTSYTFNAPQGADGKIVVFWLWVVMGETAHALTFPASVTWLSEPTFGANTQTLLALMSVDGGATWTANVQWEA